MPLVALGLLWSNHHLGIGAGHPAVMAALAAALPVALGLITQLLEKADQESISARFRKAVARVVSWRLLLILYLALGVVSLTWTSVVVQGDDSSPVGRASLLALDDPQARPIEKTSDDKKEPLRFVIPTRPFGRSFLLTLDGFVPQTIDAFPLLGVRVRAGQDLRRAPSALLRLSELATGSWAEAGGAELRVVIVRAGQAETVLLETKKAASAILLGREQPVPSAWLTQWRLGLIAAQVTDEPTIARQLIAWRQPVVHQPSVGLQPGMSLRATLTSARSKKVVARAEFLLGRDELQDQLMEDIE